MRVCSSHSFSEAFCHRYFTMQYFLIFPSDMGSILSSSIRMYGYVFPYYLYLSALLLHCRRQSSKQLICTVPVNWFTIPNSSSLCALATWFLNSFQHFLTQVVDHWVPAAPRFIMFARALSLSSNSEVRVWSHFIKMKFLFWIVLNILNCYESYELICTLFQHDSKTWTNCNGLQAVTTRQ